jgi:inner membrane protein
MASIGHVAIGLAASQWYARDRASRGVAAMAAWSLLSLLPDADVLAFRFGVPYAAPWGHRGASHSLAVALVLGVAAYVVARAAKLPRLRTTVLVALVVASHGILDTFTDGGLGCALLWPFSTERFFAPWTPIPVAPIGRRFLSARGLRVAATELVIFALPLVYGLWPRRAGGGRSGPGR